MMRSRLTLGGPAVLLSLLWLARAAPVSGQSIEQATPALVQALAEQLVAKKRPKVAALDFTDLQGRPSELGRFLAEQLSVDMVMAKGITVIDRANLNAIMAEHKLTAEGLVNPENAKKLGMFAGVDAILVGNLTTMDAQVMLTVRAVSTETAELVAGGRMRFDLTDDVRRMLGLSVSSSRGGTSVRSDSPSSAADGISTAAVAVGPVTASVKNVSHGFAGEGNRRVPQIRVTFDLENRNLNAFAAVSANSLVIPAQFQRAPTVGLIFGVLQDSSGTKWVMEPGNLRGIPTVYCFETTGDAAGPFGSPRVTQNSPSSVVDYIRRGIEYTGSELQNRTQRLWSASFASIEPGGKLEMSAVFVPSGSIRSNTPVLSGFFGSNGYSLDQAFSWPESTELSLELVVATHQDGERPEKARDLVLRNLVISRLVLPK